MPAPAPDEDEDIQRALELSLKEQADREERVRQEDNERRRLQEQQRQAAVAADKEREELHDKQQSLLELIIRLNDAFGYGEPISIPYELLSLWTSSFADSCVIGKGGFGKYKYIHMSVYANLPWLMYVIA